LASIVLASKAPVAPASRALSNQEKGFTAVLVVHEASRVVGYYGLAPTAVVPSALPRSIRTGQPPDPVPCLLLGQLATDIGWAGRGIGTGLVKHALERCVTAAGLVGGRALMVNAETRKLAAILVGDVVGYSRLAGADEDRTLARLLALREGEKEDSPLTV
jgi:GNAT superfamily N-acetyltransferase